MPKQPKVFISYSHKDNQWRDDLETHLKPYLRVGSLTSWSDKQIQAGSEWLTEIKTALASCNIAVLLVSPDFLSSDFIHEHELGPVLKEATRGGVKILWVPIRDSAYKKTPLKDYQAAVLDPSKPLASMTKARRDKAWVKICEEIEKAVNRPKESLPEAASSAVGPESALSNLPDRNPFFTGREGVLAQLQEALAKQGRAAMSGLGGIGKTQTAVEYAHRHLKEYDPIFWVSTASREDLLSGYVTIAGLLKLPESKDKDQTLAVEAVKRWLSSHEGWLLILDNADRPDIVKPFLRAESTGHVLLTSRAQVFDTIGIVRPVELNEMSPAEARIFLLKRTGREYEDGHEPSAASELAAELGFLPLALEQASAYIVRNKSLFQDYLNSFRNRALELLNKHRPVAGDYRESVQSTWSMNFCQLEKESEAAADLLRLSAFLSPDSIPLEFLATGAPELGNLLSAALVGVQEDPVVLDETLAPLTQFSLIHRQIENRSYSVHRLVQAVVRAELDPKTQRLWAERAVRALDRAFPNVEFSNWAVCDRLLAQAYTCAELISQWGLDFPEAARLLNQTGAYLYERGRYTDAESLHGRALRIWEKAIGPEHREVATSLDNLAARLETQGQYEKAEPLYQRALAIYEKAMGPEHPEVATSLNNLALLYKTQGQYEKAGALYQRSLKIREKALGPEHPEVATSLYNLGALYHDQGQYAKAEPFYQRALAIGEMAIGPEHPDVASSLINLAGLYNGQGQYAQAEALYQRSLKIQEKALGPDHPDVATSLNNLAGLYDNQGQYAKAEPLYQRSLAIFEKALRPDHPDVATSLNNLAGLYRAQGQYAQAEPLYGRALEIREKALGPEHPDVATCLENYALCLRAMVRSQKAEPLEARARAIRAKSA
jgi:tetratricopeptide (TPR) repeat protein